MDKSDRDIRWEDVEARFKYLHHLDPYDLGYALGDKDVCTFPSPDSYDDADRDLFALGISHAIDDHIAGLI